MRPPRLTCIANPAEAWWTRGRAYAFRTDGLSLNKDLPDGRFPFIG